MSSETSSLSPQKDKISREITVYENKDKVVVSAPIQADGNKTIHYAGSIGPDEVHYYVGRDREKAQNVFLESIDDQEKRKFRNEDRRHQKRMNWIRVLADSVGDQFVKLVKR